MSEGILLLFGVNGVSFERPSPYHHEQRQSIVKIVRHGRGTGAALAKVTCGVAGWKGWWSG